MKTYFDAAVAEADAGAREPERVQSQVEDGPLMVDGILDELVRSEGETRLRRTARLVGTFGWSTDRAEGFIAGLSRGRALGQTDDLDAFIDRLCDRYIAAKAQSEEGS